MNTKILDKIHQRVRFYIIEKDGKNEYVVEKKKGSGWMEISRTFRLEKALMMKHNAWHSEMHLLGYSSKLLRRRKYGKHKFLGKQVN